MDTSNLYRFSSAKPSRTFLPQELYAKALESMIVVCADVLFFCREEREVFLAKRKTKPMQNMWWFIGGRIFPFEEQSEAITRIVERETALVLSKERFRFLGMKRYFFEDRQQEPQNIPCDSLCFMFAVELTLEELTSVKLDQDEYQSELTEFDAVRLQTDSSVPQSVRDSFKQIFE